MPYYNAGVQVERNAVYIKLHSKVGITVMWNGDDAVMVKEKYKTLFSHTYTSAQNSIMQRTLELFWYHTAGKGRFTQLSFKSLL